MTTIANLAAAAVCFWVCAKSLHDIRSNMLKIMMFAGLGVIHGLVPAIVQHNKVEYSDMDSFRLEAALFAFCGISMMALGWSLYERMSQSGTKISGSMLTVIRGEQGQKLLIRLFWVCALVGLIAWLLQIRAMGTSVIEMLHAGRFAFRGEGDRVLTIFATHFVSLALVPGFVGMFLPRRYQIGGVVYAIGLAVVFYFVSHGSRAFSLGLIGGVMVASTMRYRVGPARFLRLVCFVGILGALAVSLYPLRHVMSRLSMAEIAERVIAPEAFQDALTRDPLSYNEYLVGAVQCFPHEHPYLNGATYRRMAVFFFPGWKFQDIKPEDTHLVFARVYGRAKAERNATMPPSIPGDSYINFWGWPGLGMMFLNGVILAWVNGNVRSNIIWFLAIGPQLFRLTIVGLRGQAYELFIFSIFLLLVVQVVAWLCGYSLRQANRDIAALRSRSTRHRRRKDSPGDPRPSSRKSSRTNSPRPVAS